MAEYAGYGYFAEVPGVIFDVQRAGPSTGLPTRTMQGDVSFAYTLSHGDTKHIVLLPATVAEAYELCDGGVRSRGALSNAGLRAQRSRSGHELMADAAAAVSGEAVRPRKSARRRRLELDEVVGPLSRRRQGRHPLSHAARNRSSRSRVLHARHRSRRRGALFGAARRLAAQPRSARPQDRNGQDGRARTGR